MDAKTKNMPSRRKLTQRDIRNVRDIMGGIDLCEEHEVAVDDLDTIEEVLERLWLHFETLHNDSFLGEVRGPIA